MLLNVELLVGEEVDQRSFLYEIVLTVDPLILHLLLAFLSVFKLNFFNIVGPRVAELLAFVV